MKGSSVSSLGSLGDRTIRIKLEFLDLIFYPLIVIRNCFSDRLRVAADAQEWSDRLQLGLTSSND
ncbi:hypothetical protein ACKFKG_23310 [Phormidesmis sp. 146-35]